ncbi:MAG: biopolymer transporter ExbD [Bacteroidia bacterium]|jgi:biopolymer transport protein ExbD|nr:biopolymer transporter ExbD [Paludibacter sp.]MDD3489802.1 biopolymer transporter ExbD [Paludibacter sp.]NCB69325.1 biopolymer transporter ExbD [Bacteroidia bacterium]
MALKRRNKVEASFAMSSMTDIIFLLLIFFVISSTMSSPSDIKINLPQSGAKTSSKPVVARVSIDENGLYYISKGGEQAVAVAEEMLDSYITGIVAQDTSTFIALHADQNIPYKQVVKVLDIANQHKLKLVIATKSPEK